MSDPTEQVHQAMPLTATLGIRVDRFTPDEVVLRLDWAPGLCTSGGILHGGTIMALADSAGGGCAFLNLPEGAVGTSTIDSSTHFLGAVTGGTVTATATATPLHRGRTTVVVETSVRDEGGRLVARTTQAQLVLRA
jgi:uncharacterized protein (TIGR00369 family)